METQSPLNYILLNLIKNETNILIYNMFVYSSLPTMSTPYETLSISELFILVIKRNLPVEGYNNKQDIIEKLVEEDKAENTKILDYKDLNLGKLNSIAELRKLITEENKFSLNNIEDYIALLKSADKSDM